MEARELRIGNIVTLNKRLFTIDSIGQMCGGIDAKGRGLATSIKYFDPIPLTEEWLVRMGFEEDGNLFHNKIALYKNGNGGFNYNINFYEHDNLEPVEYVHQLQNIYFALTGEELTIKPEAEQGLE